MLHILTTHVLRCKIAKLEYQNAVVLIKQVWLINASADCRK
jgi:hypothetical protein